MPAIEFSNYSLLPSAANGNHSLVLAGLVIGFKKSMDNHSVQAIGKSFLGEIFSDLFSSVQKNTFGNPKDKETDGFVVYSSLSANTSPWILVVNPDVVVVNCNSYMSWGGFKSNVLRILDHLSAEVGRKRVMYITTGFLNRMQFVPANTTDSYYDLNQAFNRESRFVTTSFIDAPQPRKTSSSFSWVHTLGEIKFTVDSSIEVRTRNREKQFAFETDISHGLCLHSVLEKDKVPSLSALIRKNDGEASCISGLLDMSHSKCKEIVKDIFTPAVCNNIGISVRSGK